VAVELPSDQTLQTEAVRPHSQRERIEVLIKDEMLSTLDERATKAPSIQSMSPAPHGPFAAASAECLGLFRDGHFYGCIALTQAIIEAVIHHAWQTKMKRKRTKAGSYNSYLIDLCSLGVVTTELKTRLDLLWIERSNSHHLNPGVETARNKLEAIALKNLQMLVELRGKFFGYSFDEGRIVPDQPEYWPEQEPGNVPISMRSEP
jgi:hypothetical protein